MNIEWIDIIIPIVSAISGGGIVGAIVSLRTSKRDDFRIIVEILRAENERLRADVEKLDTRIEELEEKYSEERKRAEKLQNQLILLESAHHDLPFPQWLKDSNGIMLSVNDAYQEIFLEPMGLTKDDYMGKSDFDVWDQETAKAFRDNDNLVKRRKKFIRTKEKITRKDADFSEDWEVVKYPRFLGRVFIGIAGIAFPSKYSFHGK